jgi:hypothetical protein
VSNKARQRRAVQTWERWCARYQRRQFARRQEPTPPEGLLRAIWRLYGDPLRVEQSIGRRRALRLRQEARRRYRSREVP